MIHRLEVKGLNDQVDSKHSLPFHEDLNIITGANGSGKTTLLKLIWYLISGNLERIRREIPLQSVSIYTDQFSLHITCDEPNKVSFECELMNKENSPLIVAVNPANGYIEQYEDIIKLDELNNLVAREMNNSLFFPTFRRIEGRISSRQFSPASPGERMHPYRTMEELQKAMSSLSSEVSLYNHKFISSISTNDIASLLIQKHVDISRWIDKLQVELSHEITQKIEDYFGTERESGTHDSQEAHLVLDNIQKRVKEISSDREISLKPFSVLSDLTRKILQYQSIHVTRQVASGEDTIGITLDEGTEGITPSEAKDAISSDKLSSGEKQMLSFLCYNAFYNNTPIFIDEPELSLHIDWQRLLLPMLLDQSTGNQFFIATHSPFIFSGYQHKEIPLKSN